MGGGQGVVAPVGHGAAVAFVTHGNIDDDVALRNAAEHIVHFVTAGLGEAGGAAQGHIDHIHAQLHAVFQGVDNGIHTGAALGAEDLHGEDLGVGSHTGNIGAGHIVGGGDTGNVGAVVAQAVIVADVVGAGGVVEGIGDLFVVVQVLGGQGAAVQSLSVQIQGIEHILNSFHIPGGAGGGVSEGRMVQIQAGIQDGHGHALAGVAQILPHIGHIGHIGGRNGEGLGLSLGLAGLEHRVQEHIGNTADGGDLFQIAESGGDDQGVGQVGVAIDQTHVAELLIQFHQQGILLGLQLCGQGSGNSGNGLIALSGGCVGEHHKGGDHIHGLILAGSLAQHLNVLGQLGFGQRDLLAVGSGCDPLAVHQAQHVLIGLLQVGLVIPQAQAQQLFGCVHQSSEDAGTAAVCAIGRAKAHCARSGS